MSFRALPVLMLACLLVALWPRAAHADVRRCVTATGQTIFTDRKCAEIDATEGLPRNPASAGARLNRAGGCARTVQELVFEITSAIVTRDANRLASVYHWPGTSAEEGYRIWTQLDVVANRQLVDVVPVMPLSRPELESPPPATSPPVATDPAAPVTRNDAEQAAELNSEDPVLYPQTTVRRNPVALRVEQTSGRGATPARTVFGLTHYFGCWWLRF